MFADGMTGAQVAAALEVSTKSAYAWRRPWKAGGENALAAKGTPGPDPVLSEQLVQKLIVKLNEGPAVAGWAEDQRWTLVRVCTLIGRMFHVTVSITTAWQILHRAGFSPQQPIARAASVTSRSSHIGAAINGRR
jgi:transposase